MTIISYLVWKHHSINTQYQYSTVTLSNNTGTKRYIQIKNSLRRNHMAIACNTPVFVIAIFKILRHTISCNGFIFSSVGSKFKFIAS